MKSFTSLHRLKYGYIIMDGLKIKQKNTIWCREGGHLAISEEDATLDLGVLSSSPMLGVGIT